MKTKSRAFNVPLENLGMLESKQRGNWGALIGRRQMGDKHSGFRTFHSKPEPCIWLARRIRDGFRRTNAFPHILKRFMASFRSAQQDDQRWMPNCQQLWAGSSEI